MEIGKKHIECACGCGAQFEELDTWGRPRRFVSGHNSLGNQHALGNKHSEEWKRKEGK